jgi:hypothetical protein
MKRTRPEVGLERILNAIERDVLDATDDEILSAAKDLGMEPSMKGSAAFIGVTSRWRFVGTDGRRVVPAKAHEEKGSRRSRRKPKGDAPPSN